MENRDTVEVVAAECHKQWAGWTAYLLGKMESWGHDKEYLLMSRVWRDRWQKQIDTPYAALSESEKESDRAEARKILAALSSAPQPNSRNEVAPSGEADHGHPPVTSPACLPSASDSALPSYQDEETKRRGPDAR